MQAAKEEAGIKREADVTGQRSAAVVPRSRGFGVRGRRGKGVRTSNKYLAFRVFWAIMSERLHFGIRNSDFEEG